MAITRLEAAVDAFAEEMKAKLRKKAAAGWSGWDAMPDSFFIKSAQDHLNEISRGEPVQDIDVANFMMFHFAKRKNL